MRFALAVALLAGCTEYDIELDKNNHPAPSATDTSFVPPDEECDGLDDDGDGQTDEDFPDTDGHGIVDCMELSHEITFILSADDEWEGDVDGVLLEDQAGSSTSNTYTFTLDSGPPVLAVHAWDTGFAISGYIAAVPVDGALGSRTGDGSWVEPGSSPAAGSEEPGFDDSAWGPPVRCDSSEVSYWWGSSPTDLTGMGAQWVWFGDCELLGEDWFRLDLDLP